MGFLNQKFRACVILMVIATWAICISACPPRKQEEAPGKDYSFRNQIKDNLGEYYPGTKQKLCYGLTDWDYESVLKQCKYVDSLSEPNCVFASCILKELNMVNKNKYDNIKRFVETRKLNDSGEYFYKILDSCADKNLLEFGKVVNYFERCVPASYLVVCVSEATFEKYPTFKEFIQKC